MTGVLWLCRTAPCHSEKRSDEESSCHAYFGLVSDPDSSLLLVVGMSGILYTRPIAVNASFRRSSNVTSSRL